MSNTRSKINRFRVGSNGSNKACNDEHSSQNSGQVYQETHQLVQLRLWSIIMKLMEARVVLVTSWSKNC